MKKSSTSILFKQKNRVAMKYIKNEYNSASKDSYGSASIDYCGAASEDSELEEKRKYNKIKTAADLAISAKLPARKAAKVCATLSLPV